jgi:hypothetical protein
MGSLSTLYQLAAADFRERTRRYSFLITLLGTLFFGFLVITGKWDLRLGEYRGEYNSAWVGSLMASAATCMLAFFGFYLVKNSLSRDRRTRVGEILATTPLSNRLYIAGKFVSNLAVLTSMAITLAVAAIVMQVLSASATRFDLWALVAPFVFVCLPAMTLVAATAVLFESIRFLRGTAGNILYFLIAEAALVSSLLLDIPVLDFSGIGLFIPSMQDAALAAYPDAQLGLQMGFVGFAPGTSPAATKLFSWGGIEWSLAMTPLRLLWIGAAMGLTVLATLFFDRFDPARVHSGQSDNQKEPLLPAAADDPPSQRTPLLGPDSLEPVQLDYSFLRMWRAELELMVKGYHWSWYLIALTLLALQLLLPYEYARAFALPVAWVWPLAMWSSMGTREERFNTGQLVFSSPYPESRQFPAMWVAGLTVAVLSGGAMMARALLAGEAGHLSALLVGAFFVPTLALSLGVVSGTKKLFEVSYLLIWYLGPINQFTALDFLGTTQASVTEAAPQTYLVISVLLLLGAVVWRRRQLTAGIA